MSLLVFIDIPRLQREVRKKGNRSDKKARQTSRHCSPFVSLTGPAIPNATSLNHQKEKQRMKENMPKTVVFVFVVYRFEEKMKWSSICESMRTAKYSVGSCRIGD